MCSGICIAFCEDVLYYQFRHVTLLFENLKCSIKHFPKYLVPIYILVVDVSSSCSSSLTTTEIFDILYFDISFFYIPLIAFKTILMQRKLKLTAIKRATLRIKSFHSKYQSFSRSYNFKEQSLSILCSRYCYITMNNVS